MGDRANVAIQDDGQRVYFYTHWRGNQLPDLVRKALAKKERWSDAPYLARIIFDTMTSLEGGTTGFGISTRIGDNNHPLLVVDCDLKIVKLENDGGIKAASAPVPFAEYIKCARTWQSFAPKTD